MRKKIKLKKKKERTLMESYGNGNYDCCNGNGPFDAGPSGPENPGGRRWGEIFA